MSPAPRSRRRLLGFVPVVALMAATMLPASVLATEGCTPGYWKQSQHFDSWPAIVGTPSTLFHDVTAAGGSVRFADAFPGKTLLQVLSQGGGGIIALGRHAAAGVLNGGSPDVNYNFSRAKTIEMFNAAYLSGDAAVIESTKNAIQAMNEAADGCPLN
jgi:hypothetical protein